jgi:hypothetical protein
MKKIFLLAFLISPYSLASEINLNCNVSGGSVSTFGKEIFRPANVNVEITAIQKSLTIIVDGEDSYVASASTHKRPNYEFMNLSDSNKFSITGTTNFPPSGSIKTQTITININRLSGLISVNTATDFYSGNFINSSYSGTCLKATTKKF